MFEIFMIIIVLIANAIAMFAVMGAFEAYVNGIPMREVVGYKMVLMGIRAFCDVLDLEFEDEEIY